MSDLKDRFDLSDETRETLVEAARKSGETCWSGGYGVRVRGSFDEIVVYRVVEVRDL